MPDQPLWRPDHPVLEVLRRRRDAGGKPGQHTDGNRVGLAVEGGGMRGVISAAMLSTIEDHGFKDAIDVVYGGSAGSVNSAYFLAGETWYPVSIYYDDLATSQFVSFARGLRGSVLDLDYAFNDVLERIKPLDYARVLASPTKLVVTVTDVDDCQTIAARDFTSHTDLKAALLAGAWLPLAVRGTATYRGHRAVDGGLLTAHPFAVALADGCTHVLSLSTRPMQPPPQRLTAMHRYMCWHLNRVRSGLGAAYIESVLRYRRERLQLADQRVNPTGPPYVLDLAPLPETPMANRHEVHPGALLEAARRAYEVMYCALADRSPTLIRDGQLRAMPKLTIVERTYDPATDPHRPLHAVQRSGES